MASAAMRLVPRIGKGTALAFCLCAFAFLAPARAVAFCSEPSAPSAPWGSSPSAPYCGSFGDLSGCSEWEIESFRDDVEEWLDEMRQYAEDAGDYANDAIEYANCESSEAIDEWNSFVGQ